MKNIDFLKNFVTGSGCVGTVMKLKGTRDVYLVGGTVRDILLGIEPNDYDFAVSGSGITFARRFAKKVGGAFVLLSTADDEARVVVDDVIYDFIGTGTNGVLFDLMRRDFTVNAMAINCGTYEFLDPHKGIKDLRAGKLRPTTDTVLKADPVRVLRGFRFALEYNLDLTRSFFRCAKDIHLTGVAAERIGYELMRILAAPCSYAAVMKMNTLGLFAEIFPEARKLIEDAYLWEHSLNTYHAIEELMKYGFFTKIDPEFMQYFSFPRRAPLVKLAALLHDVAKPDTFLLKNGEVHFYGHDTKGARIVQALGYERLKLSRHETALVTQLVKEHMRLHLLATSKELTDRAIRRFFRDLGDDWLGAMMIAWADGYATAGWTRHLEAVFMRMIELKRADEAKPTVERLINGYDLIALGLKPGPRFKVLLQELFDLQLEGKITTKEQGLKLVPELDKQL
jgi:putative nucleotidyltransferase with HDIG domain